MQTPGTTFSVSWFDETGVEQTVVEASTIPELAKEVAGAGYDGPRITVRDDAGYVRGWITVDADGEGTWRLA